MGNENSGRWTSRGAKTTVEECYVLDIADWRREGLLQPGTRRSGSWGWREAGTGKVIRDIGYGVDIRVDPHARLGYQLPLTGEYVNYRLDLVCTCPNYGGQRWWFVCPGLVSGICGLRVRKLFLAPSEEYFACRHCCDLRYASQREDYAHRAMSKAQAIRVRLGGSAAMVDEFPPKPKRMRWKTYRLSSMGGRVAAAEPADRPQIVRKEALLDAKHNCQRRGALRGRPVTRTKPQARLVPMPSRRLQRAPEPRRKVLRLLPRPGAARKHGKGMVSHKR